MTLEEFDHWMEQAHRQRQKGKTLLQQADQWEAEAIALAGIQHVDREPGFPGWTYEGAAEWVPVEERLPGQDCIVEVEMRIRLGDLITTEAYCRDGAWFYCSGESTKGYGTVTRWRGKYAGYYNTPREALAAKLGVQP